MLQIIVAGVVAFASTNIDDLFILTLFFGDKKYKPIDIYIGQYLGIISLIAISVIGSFIGNFIDTRYIGLMGLVPIYLGIKQIIHLIRNRNKEEDLKIEKKSKTGILTVASLTFANGGDNIGIYIPLFATLSTFDKTIMISIFLAMTLTWVTAARYLATRPILAKGISKYGHIITPVVLCLLGFFILQESNTMELFPGK